MKKLTLSTAGPLNLGGNAVTQTWSAFLPEPMSIFDARYSSPQRVAPIRALWEKLTSSRVFDLT
jgi:hypothetical protein